MMIPIVGRTVFSSVLLSGVRRCTGQRYVSVSCVRRDIFKIQDEKDFDEKVLKSKEPVIVDFFATWCGPCKILEPRLEIAVGGHKDSVHLAKVDIDEQDSLAAKYNVSSLPTVYAFRNGQPTDHFIGVRDQDVIQAFVANAVSDARK